MKKPNVIFTHCSRASLANPFSGVPYSQRVKMAGIKEKSKNYKTIQDGKYSKIVPM